LGENAVQASGAPYLLITGKAGAEADQRPAEPFADT